MTDFSYKEGEIHWKYYSIYLLKLWEKIREIPYSGI